MTDEKKPAIVKFGTVSERDGYLIIEGFSFDSIQGDLASGAIQLIIDRLEQALKEQKEKQNATYRNCEISD